MATTTAADLTIAEMRFEDIPEVYALEQASHITPWSNSALVDCLRMKYGCWVMRAVSTATQDNPPILGFAVVMTVVDELHLLNIVVAPEHQGQGLGGLLLADMLEKGRQQQAVSMFLEVRESNLAAQALYRRFGFEVISQRKAYYPLVEGGREAALVMKADI